MGTNASIVVKKTDGKYIGVYVNFDGYLDHTGRLLKQIYNTYEKAIAVVGLGGISFLGERLAPPEGSKHSWSKPIRGETVTYFRDAGEKFRQKRADTAEDAGYGTGYDYVFEDGEWTCNGMKFGVLPTGVWGYTYILDGM